MQKELPKGGPCSKSVFAPGQEIRRTCLKNFGVVNGIDSFLKSALSLGLCTAIIRGYVLPLLEREVVPG